MTATTEPRAARVTAEADAVLDRTGLLRHPYLRSLADGTLPLPRFRASQEQFFHAVRYFPRPMAALAARLPDPADRLGILHNLLEEHGDLQPSGFHVTTFSAFLRSIGGAAPDRPDSPYAPFVHAFNLTLMAACTAEETEVGLGCLGIVERAFASISAQIGQGVVARGWVAPAALAHYTLHAELDLRHAEDFFAVAEPAWDDDRRRRLVVMGLEVGAYAFARLYDGMAAAGE